ncbi:sialate O-acetylesterase [Phenylobacterium sp.]|uniref:sialate O-acetylesterase n=1 Tax=Phenylobacterium sp. TaxID=1871053 RepID=UPI00286EB431|nr:sialate O-acetylesterase [Phenylobacterium sp.]
MAFVVFAGQSNIGGAFMSAATLSKPWVLDPLTFIWDQGGKAWAQMQPGVNTGYGGQSGVWGPEVQFALDFRAKFPGEVLNILKTADGGTGLALDPAAWHYDWSPQSRDELFDRTSAAIAEAGASLGGVRPGAVFFGQGEEDATHADAAGAYAANLPSFLTAVRLQWMGDASGKVGLFQIASTTPHAELVRAAQQSTDRHDPNAASFDTNGFPLQVDGIHYAPAGYNMIGASFMRAYEAWRGGEPGANSPAGAGQVLNGTAGADILLGGAANDSLGGGPGEDFMRGGEGDDLMSGGDAFDDMHGNQGSDTLAGNAGGDWVVGGKDNDLLFGEDGDDIVYGNLGSDTCDGGAGQDLVRGGQGDDVLFGWSGADWLSGDRGDDTISGGSGADTFHTFGEAGLDLVLDFNFAEGDRVNLLSGTAYVAIQSGSDVVIDMTGGGQLVLQAVQISSLGPGWIFGA